MHEAMLGFVLESGSNRTSHFTDHLWGGKIFVIMVQAVFFTAGTRARELDKARFSEIFPACRKPSLMLIRKPLLGVSVASLPVPV